ncbi:hypothetical protein CYMTET_16647 [Cymbomonas tetramitiformis]|uniref:Uncharacterized protein n=1 Tax=Cymbomonas tetramitiformis TaxID=36881 RepID=A0AAE0L835_9CHLO|nr:hypothetical protein CYMTET_16647 [Cymbomonas tetramitiformis]
MRDKAAQADAIPLRWGLGSFTRLPTSRLQFPNRFAFVEYSQNSLKVFSQLFKRATTPIFTRNLGTLQSIDGVSSELWSLSNCVQCRRCGLLQRCRSRLWRCDWWNCAPSCSSQLQCSAGLLHGGMRCKVPR